MIDIINKYRNSPERTWIHMAMKTDILMGGRGAVCETNDALIDVRSIKRGGFTCRRDLNIRLCDLYFVSGVMLLGWWALGKITGNK